MAYKDKSDPRLLEKRREHYRNNKQAYIERARAREVEMRDYVLAQKARPCVDCGISYPSEPWLMEFDHRDPITKVAEIGKMIKKGSWDRLLAELDKCDLLCVVCHRRRSAARGNWGTEEAVVYLLN